MTMMSSPSEDAAPRISSGSGLAVAGVGVLLLFVATFAGWSYIVPVGGAVIASGSVVVESSKKVVQHLEGGIVGSIHVREGQFVDAGALLVRLDNTRTESLVESLTGEYANLVATEARLLAEREGRASVEFPADVMARLHVPAFGDAARGQQQLFATRRESLDSQIQLLESRIPQIERAIEGLAIQVRSKEGQAKLIGAELASVRKLYQQGYERLPRLLALERTATALEGERGELTERMAQFRLSSSEIAVRVADLQKTRRNEVEQELSTVRPKLLDVRERLKAAQDTLDRIEIRAPNAGYVVDLQVNTIGSVIPPGAQLMFIVPKGETMIVKAMARPEDVNDIVTGQSADVMFTGSKFKLTPRVPAIVTNVSADRLEDKRTGAPYYEVRVQLDAEFLATLPEVDVVPGMPAEVFISTQTRTPFEYFIGPITQRLSRALRES